MKYDLSNLDSRSFENLCADIISKEIKSRVEIFTPGKDGGVDGRFWLGKTGEGILQAKHYPNSSSTEVKSAAKKEVSKVISKNPARYIFMSSGKITVKAKSDIMAMFSPYIKREDDIWGCNEIQSYLLDEKNFDIVQKYTQLYIYSAQIIKKVLGDSVSDALLSGTNERSKFLFECIKESVNKFVITSDYYKAIKKLDKSNVVVITGEAGIGKTTLSNMLSFEYVKQGYSFYSITDIKEAEKILANAKKKEKIIFYYDDFLGENFARFIRGNEGSEIILFINRVNKSNEIKLILNSRTTVLNRAIYNNHSLADGKIKKNEHLLTIDNLSDIDKAMILYRHMYFSNLDGKYVDEIYKNRKYIAIIKHPNFSPRIIEYILDEDRVKASGVKEAGYIDYIISALDNPKDIWSDYFEKLNVCTKKLIFLITFNQYKQVSQKKLKEAYLKYINENNLENVDDCSFDYVIKVASDALVQRRFDDKNEYQYMLFNPSVGDYVLKEYFSGEENEITKLVIAWNNINSLKYLTSLNYNGYIDKVTLLKIQKKVFNALWVEKLHTKNYEWLIFLINIDYDNLNKNNLLEVLSGFLSMGANEAQRFSRSEFYKMYYLLNFYGHELEIKKHEFLWNYIIGELDSSDFEYLFKYLCENEVGDETIYEAVAEKYTDFIFSNIEDHVDIDYTNYVQIEKDGSFSINKDGIIQEVTESVEKNFVQSEAQEFLTRTSFDLADVLRDVGHVFTSRARDRFEEAFVERYSLDNKRENDYRKYSEIDEIFRR